MVTDGYDMALYAGSCRYLAMDVETSRKTVLQFLWLVIRCNSGFKR
jgi:hypothetical protein